MFKRINEYFLAKYAGGDDIIQHKSRVILALSVSTVIISIILLISLLIRQVLDPGLVLSPLVALVFAFTALVLLRRGWFSVVSHSLLIVLFAAVWITLFTDRSHILARLDTVTFLVCILSMVPLVVTKKKVLVFVYTAANIAVFVVFALFSRKELGLSGAFLSEYMIDVIVPLASTGIIAYLIFYIYMKSIDKAQASEREVQRQYQEIQRQNEELSAANEELEAMYEELNATHEEMVKVNDMLSEEKELMSTTFRSMDEAVITADVRGAVILMNRMAEQLTGWSREIARGEPLDRVLPIVSGEGGDKSPCGRIISGEDIAIQSFENMMLDVKGGETFVSGSCSPVFDYNGRLSGVVMIVRDITQRKKMEDELRKASHIETLGVFAGGIAHDLNNLLTAVLGNISVARYEAGAGSVLNESLQSAEDASLKTKDLARQLLTFTKGGEPVRETLSMRELIVESARFALSGSGIACDFSIGEDLWNVRADRGQMGQVIHNIVLNARQALDRGGQIRISAVNTEGGDLNDFMAAPGRYVKVSIADTGPGIPANLIEKIFDPFFTTKKDGSGLGLAITYSIVKKHDGHIRVKSDPGSGAVFEIIIPATDDRITEADRGQAEVVRGAGKVLVVDDDRNILKVLVRMLSNLGFSAETAEDGESSVKMYRAAKNSGAGYDCVIMDLTMRGGMSGDDAVRILRQFDGDAKVIVSSGYANDPIIANYREYGFDDSLQKPFRINDLQSVLARVLR